MLHRSAFWNGNEHTVYLLDGSEIRNRLEKPRSTLVQLVSDDWSADFSPWPAKRIFASGEDFAGGGARTLEFLQKEIRQEATIPNCRTLVGYSLAGLFALWCGCETDYFDQIACLSGSLWFDGFSEYLRTHRPRFRAAVLSLGRKESQVRNPRLVHMEETVLETAELLRKQGVTVSVLWNAGGHYTEIPQRIAGGIAECNRLWREWEEKNES